MTRLLRWTMPVGLSAVVVAATLVVPSITAAAGVDLPGRTPAQLLTDLQGSDVTAVQGTVRVVADLGLPSLPSAATAARGPHGTSATDLTSILSGTTTMRVWASHDGRRVAVLGTLGETDVVTRRHRGVDLVQRGPDRHPPDAPADQEARRRERAQGSLRTQGLLRAPGPERAPGRLGGRRPARGAGRADARAAQPGGAQGAGADHHRHVRAHHPRRRAARLPARADPHRRRAPWSARSPSRSTPRSGCPPR